MSLRPKRLVGGAVPKKTIPTKQKRRVKTAQTRIDIETHLEKSRAQSSTIRGAKISGPVNEEFWVDVTSPKRGAWKWHKVSDVKKEMKEYIPKAQYDGYFDGAKDNPNRTVYFKVPVGAELRGIHYND